MKNELVVVKDGKAVCTSLMVAEKFGKNHFDVLKGIKNLECSQSFRAIKQLDEIVTECMRSPEDMDIHLSKLHRLKEENLLLSSHGAFLCHCVTTFIMQSYKDVHTMEKDIYTIFRRGYRKMLGNHFSIVNIKSNPKHRPDFWVKDTTTNEIIPVEIKKGEITNAAITQITRYMSFYTKGHGIVVGSSLNTTIMPKNITFINYKNY